MSGVISTGLIMGFSASLVCLGWCIPVIIPYSATAERPGIMSGLASSFLFCVGRLLSYIGLVSLFLIFGKIVTISPILGAVATLVSGIILVLSGLSSVGAIKTRSGFGRLLCQQVASTRSPLYLGALTGLRPCGPLLAALAFMLTLHTIPKISLFMFSFWIASSILVMVFGVAGGGFATVMGRRLGIARLRSIIGMAMIVIGCYLTLTGTISLFWGTSR
jgi:sulfite exporter TauE/SafE